MLNFRSFITIGVLALVSPIIAQVPNTMRHSILSPMSNHAGTFLAYAVAVDGRYTVVGSPSDNVGHGVVKVFDSTSGALLFTLTNPNSGSKFGYSVAVSGTRVVVGAPLMYAGATDVGIAYVYDLSNGTPTVPVAILNNPSPQVGDQFGTAVAISGTRAVVGTPLDNTGATDAGSVYVYDLSSGTPAGLVATLNNPSPQASDLFGYAVAISGSRLVVGAPVDNTTAQDSGSCYAYDLNSGTPTVPFATINNPNASSTWFSRSLAISGTRLVVGAPFDEGGATNGGIAYCYDLSNGTPTAPVFSVNNPSPELGDQFGSSVAISGTYLVIGADRDDTGATDAGSAYVYDLSSGTSAVPVATLNNPGASVNDNFGYSIAISGTQVVVGTPYDDTGATNSGSGYVYDLSSSTSNVPLAILSSPSASVDDQFGGSVAVSGTRVVVGAPFNDTAAANGGRAYVYDRDSVTPTVPVATLSNPSPQALDLFGSSVAISGSLVVVGCPQGGFPFRDGIAYVYDLNSGTPTVPVATLNNPNATPSRFGDSVAISGARVVVGAPSDNTGANYAGRAYVYDLSSGAPAVPVATLNNPSLSVGDQFGSSVAISGMRVVVGTPWGGAGDAGSCYVYDMSNGAPTVPVATLSNPSPATNDQFGFCVAISGTRLLVGTPNDDTGATDAGSSYVYDLVGSAPTLPIAAFNNPSPQAGDQFGSSVAISGTRVVVGTPMDNTGATDAGSAYVYDLSSGTPGVPVATLNNPSLSEGDQFGASVALDADTVVVGTPNDDTAGNQKGATYVFGPDSIDAPEIAVTEGITGNEVLHSGTHSFDSTLVNAAASVTFSIKNIGINDLTGLSILIDGADSADFTVTSNPTSPVSGPSGATNFTVQFSPGSLGSKSAALHIVSNDTDENPFDINLIGVGINNVPTISNITQMTIDEDGNTGLLPYTIGDVESSADELILSRASDNTVLVPTSNIVISGTGATRTVTVTPAPNKFGTATITISVSDGLASAVAAFLLTVTSVNDAPTISDIADRVINEDANTGTLPFTIGDAESAATALTVTRLSSNTVLVPTANIVLSGSGASRTVRVTPAANQFGTATITVTVSDGANSTSDTFLLVVNSVNDPPTISNIVDQTINVNTLTNSLPFTVADVETAAALLIVTGASSNSTLVTQGNIFFGGAGANRTITVIPETDQIGSATITVAVSDGSLTRTDSFVINVLAPAEIAIEQPFGTGIPDGGSKSFGNVTMGGSTSLNFFIRNVGSANLTGLTITKDGTDASMFTITTSPTAPISGPNGNTAFTVRFAPTSLGPKTAAIHIASNDQDEDPFDITLTGNGVIPITSWRQTYFGSPDNSGDGADLNDYDHDGLVNLVEYAFGLNPSLNNGGQLPQGQIVGSNFVTSFTEPVGVTGITYGAEWSATMAINDWLAIPDTGTPPQHIFSVPIGTNMGLFMRLKVTSP
jgi:hypothetical protein